MTRPRSPHDRRAAILDALAVMAGCEGAPPAGAAGSDRPDVLRWSPARRLLFVGDAKDTEGPGRALTRVQLLSYVLHAARAWSSGWTVMVALCVRADRRLEAWVRLLSVVVAAAGFCAHVRASMLGESHALVWCCLGRRSGV